MKTVHPWKKHFAFVRCLRTNAYLSIPKQNFLLTFSPPELCQLAAVRYGVAVFHVKHQPDGEWDQ